MLVQSTAPRTGHPARIELLPALPPQWPEGHVSGLLARGGFEVNIKWRDGKLAGAEVTNVGARTPVDVAYAGKQLKMTLESGATQLLDGQLSNSAPH
jgi:alpha-L-fucosidase 2